MTEKKNTIEFNYNEQNSTAAAKIVEYLEKEVVRLRRINDHHADEITTADTRGKIAQTLRILKEIKPKYGGKDGVHK